MTVAGIICEYNPMHLGHASHIEKTRKTIGEDCAVVCVMSGNFVQRGDFAVFSKHARAEAAIRCGADLVIELPVPYVLSSSEGFAEAGVFLLECLGAEFISFGSESGDVSALSNAAELILSQGAGERIKAELAQGVSYARACQNAADALMGNSAGVFKSPNNLLGIEYIKATIKSGAKIRPVTFKRTGGEHDGTSGLSSSNIRRLLADGEAIWHYMPEEAALVYREEIKAGRGPVFASGAELAMLSRLRGAGIEKFAAAPGASEGFYMRVMRAAASEPTVDAIAKKAKTKRYAMSRIRRMLMCVCLGVTRDDSSAPPPYIRVLAMNETGAKILKKTKTNTPVPVVVKPSDSRRLTDKAARMMQKESGATDFYTLCYPGENNRTGGSEWRISPKFL